ncbi:MAG: PQQ-like beta-propeller repeat protein [Planctomycetaceae bacterium]|nr:PQQ-like beta-propeller repeat protein [Planctomycetaceae bacterium]
MAGGWLTRVLKKAGRADLWVFRGLVTWSREHPVLLSTLLIALIGIATGLLYYLPYLQWQLRLQEAWRQADRSFAQGQFFHAEKEYGDVQTVAQEREEQASEHIRHSEVMAELSRLGNETLAELAKPEQSWEPAFRQLQDLFANTAELREQSSQDAVLQTAFQYSWQDRWGVVTTSIADQAVAMQDEIQCVDIPSSDKITRLEEAIGFLRNFPGDTSSLTSVLAWGRRRLDVVAATEQFGESSQQSLQSLGQNDLARTRELWQSLKTEFGLREKADCDGLLKLPSNLWDAYVANLKQELKNRIEVFAGADAVVPQDRLMGTISQLPLPVLPTQDYAALAVVSTRGTPPKANDVVFTRVEDRCYGLNPKSGHPVWVLRVGFDAASLPTQVEVRGEKRFVVPWVCETGNAVSVANEDLEVQWTWQLPPGSQFTGPPAVQEETVCFSLNTGHLVELALADGHLKGLATLPSQLAGPLHVTEDGGDAVIVGKNLVIYFLKLKPTLELTDILFSERDLETVSASATWIPPFALVFRNDLSANCELTAYFHDRETGFREVARRQLKGRVWRPPVVNGTRFLVITDLGLEVVFGLRVDDLRQPLFETFRQDAPARATPQLPYVTRHVHSPFLAALGPLVISYGLDQLESQVVRQRKAKWQVQASEPATVPVQPVQTADDGVVVVTRNGVQPHVRTECYDVRTGELRWRTELGSPLAEWRVHRQKESGRTTVLARSESFEGYRLALDGETWSASRLAEIPANETAGYTFETFSVLWTESEPTELVQTSLEGVPLNKVPLRNPADSPLHVMESGVTSRSVDGGDSKSLAGLWTTFIDNAGQWQCLSATPDQPRVQAVSLGRDLPTSGWHRIQDLDGSRFLASHPDGHVAVADLLRDEQILFLKLQAQRTLPGGLIQRPLLKQKQLWAICDDGFCRGIDLDTLDVVRRVRLPAMPEVMQIAEASLVVGLRDGQIATIKTDTGLTADTPDGLIPVGRDPIEFLVSIPGTPSLFAVDVDGRLTKIHVTEGSFQFGPKLPRSSLPPLIVGDSLLYGSIEGSVQRVRLDKIVSVSEENE